MLAILKEAAPAIVDAPVSPPRAVLPVPVMSSSFRTWRVNGRNVEIDKENFLRERRERMANALVVVKRAPDEPVVTVNATDTALYPT
jgi:hypothetical protein